MKKWSLAVAAVALFTSLSMTSAGAMTRLSATQMDRVTAGHGSAWATASGAAVGLIAVSSSNAGSVNTKFFNAAGASNTSFAVYGFAASTASAAAH